MDYEKKYKEALQRAKDFKDGIVHHALEPGESIVNWIFPELRESEDEKIRKGIIKFFSESDVIPIISYEAKQAWLDWLERQKTPSVSFDKPPIGFDVGSTVVYHNDEIDGESIRKWLIGYFDEIGDSWTHREFTCRQILSWLDNQKCKDSLPIQETCKENADSFTDDEDEKIRKFLIMIVKNLCKQNFVEVTKSDVLAWLEKQKEITPADGWDYADKRMSHPLYLEGFEAGISVERELSEFEKQKEQKPAKWEDYKDKIDVPYYSSEPECSSCSKNLEGYIHGRADAENKLWENYGIVIMPDYELRMKPRWKPSEEQMEALQIIVRYGDKESTHIKNLTSLYEQLKKI